MIVSRSLLKKWGAPTILDSDSLLRGSVHGRAAAQVQPAVQGRSRADGARDRQAHRRGRPRPGDQRGHPGQLAQHLATYNPEPVPDLNPVERARLKEMEDEIRRLRIENEFLKKAAAFF